MAAAGEGFMLPILSVRNRQLPGSGTPSFIEAVDTLHKLDSLLSIQKLSPERSRARLPATKTSTINLPTTATANASDTTIPPDSNLPATDKLPQDIQNEYRARLEETEHQLRMLEAIIEDNEMRHAEEISAAEAIRNELARGTTKG